MLNKIFLRRKYFMGGLLSGISISYPFLIFIYILGHYWLISGLMKEKISFSNLLSGWLFGVGFFFGSMYWIVNPFLIYEEHFILAPIILLIFPLLMGLFFCITSIMIPFFQNNLLTKDNFFFQCFLISFCLFLPEYLRSHLFGGLPFNLTAHIWIINNNFISIASYIGVFGLSFLTILWMVMIILLIKKRTSLFIIPLFFFPIFLISFSFIKELNSDNNFKDDKILLRVVQPNIPQKEKWSRINFQKHIDKLLELSKPTSEFNEMIVVWPEAAITDFFNEREELIRYLKEKIGRNVTLITGGLRRSFKEKSFRIYNSFFVLNKEEVIHYDKQRLVPFGEFIPLRSIFDFLKLTPGKTDFSKGDNSNHLEFKYSNEILVIEPSICYEAIFQTFNEQQIIMLVNLTNDAWFGNLAGPRQHLTASIFRSVEKGVPLIRSANSGISVITDSNGKIIKEVELNQTGFIESEITFRHNSTFFMKFKNNTILYLISIIFIMCIILDVLIKKRKDLKIK